MGCRAGRTGATYSHVRDLEVLLEANEVASTALVGCSMGGGIGLDYALVHPEQVWALVPVATGLGGFDPRRRKRNGGPSETDRSRRRSRRATSSARRSSGSSLGTARHRSTSAAPRIHQIAFDNLHEILMDESGEERLDPPAAHRLEEIDVPTLVLEAEHDPPDMRRLADFLVREVIGARKVVVEGADHVVNMRQPERFEELVLPFLADAAPWQRVAL